MRIRVLIRALACGGLVFLATGCSDDDQKLCATCPPWAINAVTATAFDYVESHRAAFQMRDEIDQVRPYETSQDEVRLFHVRFHQFYQGVQVEGGGIIVHLTQDTLAYATSGALMIDVTADIHPTVTQQQAIAAARDDFATDGYQGDPSSNLQLLVYRVNGEPGEIPVDPASTDHLCWVLTLYGTNTVEIREYFIDAHDLEVVHYRSLIIT